MRSYIYSYEMRRLDIFDLFDDVFISSDYNTKKPDIRFYKELINKHDIDVSKSLFIGNDSTTDIEGCKGMPDGCLLCEIEYFTKG